MAREARFARYEWALWPDGSLLAAADEFVGPMFYIRRLEHRFWGGETLIIELTDNDFLGDTAPGPRHHRRVLRLTWTSRIFALESYDEFYAGPFGTHHPARQGVPPSNLFEVTNDPDPWIEEILAENDNTDTFPPYGVPVLVSERLRRLEGDVKVTGRFFASDAKLSDGGRQMDFFRASAKPWTAEERAEMTRQRQAARAEMVAQPRYRHLFIASETHMLEVLCEDLPVWEVVTLE